MPRLAVELKLKIICLHREGFRVCDILKILEEENSFSIGRRHVAKFLRMYEKTGELCKPIMPNQRPFKKQTDEIVEFVDRKMEENDKTTLTDLVKMTWEHFQLKISESTVCRTRRRLGWLSTGIKYCQLVREANRVKRLQFCRELTARKEEFNDVIFTDESSIALERHSKISFHRWWEPPRLKGRPKHPVKVHVWAGIPRCGVTKMAIFSGIMDAPFFVESVLQRHLVPFIRTVFPDSHRFMQDNDPKHTSNLAKTFYETAEINWWPTPPESPDLNPIELVWHELKQYLRKTCKPTGLRIFGQPG